MDKPTPRKNKTRSEKAVKVIMQYEELTELRKCCSKSRFRDFLMCVNSKWKLIFKYYVQELFVMDIYTRRMNNRINLLNKQQFFYNCIEDPNHIYQVNFMTHNIIKNFCTGMANFVSKRLTEIEKKALETIEA